jgi:hypothetical protein
MAAAVDVLLDAKTTMIEQHIKLNKAAKLAGVSVRAFRIWLEQSGLTFAKGTRGAGHATLIPESVVERVIAEHSVRLTG